MDTDVFHSEIDEWLKIINGNYGTKNLFGGRIIDDDKEGTIQEKKDGIIKSLDKTLNKTEYNNPFRNNYEKTEISVKLEQKHPFITHINSPNEIDYYKKINSSKSLDWMGATSSTPFNFFVETTKKKREATV